MRIKRETGDEEVIFGQQKVTEQGTWLIQIWMDQVDLVGFFFSFIFS